MYNEKIKIEEEKKMKENRIETIKNLFEGKEIRSVWNSEEE